MPLKTSARAAPQADYSSDYLKMVNLVNGQ